AGAVVKSRAVEFLALNRNTTLLLAAIVLIGAGEETWMRFLPKYLESAGAPVFVIGLFDALKTLLGGVYAYPGGVVVDRFGHRKAFVGFTLLSIAGYGIVLVPHWAAVIGGMFLFLAWSNLSLPATFSLVAASLPVSRHTMGIGVQSLIKRIPIVAGPLAGGVILHRFGIVEGVRIGVILSIALAAGAVVLQSLMRDVAVIGTANMRITGAWRQFNAPLRRLLLSDVLARFCERLPFAWVVIHAMDNLGLTARQVGVLIAIEMITAIACYVPTAYLADRFGKEPFVVATFGFFTLFPLSLWIADGFGMMALAFVVRGLKEFGDPARKALIVGCAPAASRGQVVGAYYLIRDTVVAGGSFAGAALWKIGPAANFAAAAAVGVLGTMVYIVTLRTRVREDG
ncbi:MAG: MFS transporter, partial [Bryobacteraceae bacterium]